MFISGKVFFYMVMTEDSKNHISTGNNNYTVKNKPYVIRSHGDHGNEGVLNGEA